MFLCTLVVFILDCLAFAHGKIVFLQFPVHLTQTSAQGNVPRQITFELESRQNPVKKLRAFCYATQLQNGCSDIRSYLIDILSKSDDSLLNNSVEAYDDDTIIVSDGSTISSLLSWQLLTLNIDLEQLGISPECAILRLPAFSTDIEEQVNGFCTEHALKGIYCRELYSDASNFLTSLYHRPGGVTLRNLLEGMHFQDYFQQLWFLIDMVKPQQAGQVTRHYFAPDADDLAIAAAKLCSEYAFSRATCGTFVEYLATQIDQYYAQTVYQLWSLLYVSRALTVILTEHAQNNNNANNASILTVPVPEPISSEYVDADFIEIGTSNFNTITQLIDESDHLIGFAIEPSIHYLNSLPDVTGVTKVNCAIVPALSAEHASLGGSEVDLYYIPEEVIRTLQLDPNLMGCNAIGGYHQLHRGFEEYVVVDKVPAHTIATFLQRHRIRKIRLLKIDAEGYDVVILEELYQYIVAQGDQTLYPERIVFESNFQVAVAVVRALVAKYVSLGYRVIYTSGNDDTILERLT